MLATMLISSGLAYGQIAVDVNKDGKVDATDLKAIADADLANEQGGLADVNKDGKVNVTDIVTEVNLINNGKTYFVLATMKVIYSNLVDYLKNSKYYNSTAFASLADVLRTKPSISITAKTYDQRYGVILSRKTGMYQMWSS